MKFWVPALTHLRGNRSLLNCVHWYRSTSVCHLSTLRLLLPRLSTCSVVCLLVAQESVWSSASPPAHPFAPVIISTTLPTYLLVCPVSVLVYLFAFVSASSKSYGGVCAKGVSVPECEGVEGDGQMTGFKRSLLKFMGGALFHCYKYQLLSSPIWQVPCYTEPMLIHKWFNSTADFFIEKTSKSFKSCFQTCTGVHAFSWNSTEGLYVRECLDPIYLTFYRDPDRKELIWEQWLNVVIQTV